LFTRESYFAIPAYPLESVFDPTGRGDTFLPEVSWGIWPAGEDRRLCDAPRHDLWLVMASFNVEEFGTDRVRRLNHDEITNVFRAFKQMTLSKRFV